eukprot:Blabericola_migrator_1__5012@NODE_25_length_21156_cov_56_925364_g22_i0_p12_GENE_NODE_25_length_21156_cov_56_925364_g22_i0NODE_25_length_21156_cov_56_925364_g22_i0_p12_ORF_typecomplete_len110_score5_62_NODE_25_length_21156_cov_56_925364_g22_i01736517694
MEHTPCIDTNSDIYKNTHSLVIRSYQVVLMHDESLGAAEQHKTGVSSNLGTHDTSHINDDDPSRSLQHIMINTRCGMRRHPRSVSASDDSSLSSVTEYFPSSLGPTGPC